MKYFFKSILLLAIFFSVSLLAQVKDTVRVQDYYASGGKEGTLNDAVAAVRTANKLSTTVFKLSSYGLYILSGTITTPSGSLLEIVAPNPGTTPNSALPQICWTTSTAPSKTFNFDIGGEVRMKNIWIMSSDVAGTTAGIQRGSSLRVGDSASVAGGKCRFENVIFEYVPCPGTASGAVEIYATKFVGKFVNCYFKNLVDTHFRYYGRAVSFRFSSTGLHADSLSFENCTFANLGYGIMQEGSEYCDNVYVNHCTFVNIVMFPFESTWWYKFACTNSIFVNTQMFGTTPATDGSNPFGGTMAIDSVKNFGFTPPFTDVQRKILFSNNSYFVEKWLTDWMVQNPYSVIKHNQRQDDMIPQPMPMLSKRTKMFFDTTDASGKKIWKYMNRANLYDGVDPGFKLTPTNIDSLKIFMWKKWDDNSNCNWAWNIYEDQQQKWPMKEDLSYTNATLKTAAMGGYPLGDLYRWWPTQYTAWSAQAASEKTNILNMMNNGVNAIDEVPNVLPENYTLGQNYPNPFNPTTQISYTLPKAGSVTLKVYNTLGQLVATLVNGFQNAGNYSATFDAHQLSSGIYFYQLQADNVSITKKLVLMK